MQGHFINLDTWNSFSDEQKAELETAFKGLETSLWDLAINTNGDALDCNVGADSCTDHKKFDMTLVEINDEDVAKIKEIAQTVVLPMWKDTCNAVDPNCSATWNETAGKAAGLTIE